MLWQRKQTIRIGFTLILVLFVASCSAQSEINLSTDNRPRFILVLPKEYWQSIFPEMQGEVNIFSVSWEGTDLRPMFNDTNGYNYVEGVSFSKRQILFSSSLELPSLGKQALGALYVWDMGETNPIWLSDSFLAGTYPFTPKALWLSDHALIHVGQLGNEMTLLQTQVDNGVTSQVLSSENSFVHPPLRLLSVSTGGYIYWQNGIITPETSVIETDYWRIRSNGEEQERIGTKDGTQLPFFSVSPDGNLMVLGKSILDSNFKTIVDLPLENDPSNVYWSQSSQRLFISVRSCNTPKCDQYNMTYYIWTYGFTSSFTQANIDIEATWAIWSPSEEQLLLYSYADDNNGSRFLPFVFDLESDEILTILTDMEAIDTIRNYHVFWEP